MKYSIIFLLLLSSGISMAQSPSLLKKGCDLPCLNKTYEVFVHMVQDSLGNTAPLSEISEALSYTSALFEPICIDFRICEVDSLRDYSFDSIPEVGGAEAQELQRLQHRLNRINIYVVSNLPPNVCGFASLGQINSPGSSTIFYARGCGGETMAHEMGHLFGLLHTFESGGELELVNGSNCATAGDLVCDTPADPFVENSDTMWVDGDCEFIFPGLDPNGEYYTPLTGNTMSYMCGGCGFTKGQYERMVMFYRQNAIKNW